MAPGALHHSSLGHDGLRSIKRIDLLNTISLPLVEVLENMVAPVVNVRLLLVQILEHLPSGKKVSVGLSKVAFALRELFAKICNLCLERLDLGVGVFDEL